VSKLDCQRCGACCAAPFWTNTIADFDDRGDFRRLKKLPIATQRRIVSVTVIPAQVSTRSKKDRHGNVVCAALRGAVNNDPERPSQCSCSIYEHRPRVCRLFKPGCGLCLDARRDFEIPKKAHNGSRRR